MSWCELFVVDVVCEKSDDVRVFSVWEMVGVLKGGHDVSVLW